MEVDRRYFEGLMAGKRFSLRGLAARMGMQHSQLRLTLSGQRRLQLDEAARLSEIFGVPLHRIAAAAGAVAPRPPGRRVPLIGAMGGNGLVIETEPGAIERAMAPEGLPDDVVAVQARAADTALAWMDGWVCFMERTDGVLPESVGRFCLVRADEGLAMATVRRGYREGTYNLSGPVVRESVRLLMASPVLLTRM